LPFTSAIAHCGGEITVFYRSIKIRMQFQNQAPRFLNKNTFIKSALLSAILLFFVGAFAQTKSVSGVIINDFTKEKVPFASVYWKNAKNGTLTDAEGKFKLYSDGRADTIVVSYVGFKDLARSHDFSKDTNYVTILLREAKENLGVVVKTKFSKGLRWWKKVVDNRVRNNPYQYENYKYELYSKVELDLANFNRESFKRIKILQPFAFVLDNIDSTTEPKPFLPIFMTEAISNYYYSRDPYKVREEMKAAETSGIKSESVLQFIGGINQKINCYEDYIQIFDKEFISPLSSFGDKYYYYKGIDTQYVDSQRYFHLYFTPLKNGDNTFSGDCWIHDRTWGIWKINLSINEGANINFTNRLGIVQEFNRNRADSNWVFHKDKFITEMSPLPKEKLAFIARKTSMYKDVSLNDSTTASILARNDVKEDLVIDDSLQFRNLDYIKDRRHEKLSKNETAVYKMIDTIKGMPYFQKLKNTVEFLVTGYKKIGKVELGPWFRFISANQLEKFRVRLELGTTEKFSKYLRLHGYLAYGFGDKKFKGQADFTYKFPGESGFSVGATYRNDLDNGRARYNEEDASTDNLFSQLVRRSKDIKQKFLLIEEQRFFVTKEFKNRMSLTLNTRHADFETFTPLPAKDSFYQRDNKIVNTDFGFKFRYAPGERKWKGHRKDFKIKGEQPVYEFGANIGVPNILGSEYTYQKLTASITHQFRFPRWGRVNYMVYAGKYFQREPLPFMLLEMHPGNEILYYSREAFNLMNRFEYISDQYVGINVEHVFDKKLLNVFHFLRKSNMRQFWNFKAVLGTMSNENKMLNRVDFAQDYRFHSLNGKPYIEVGTGIENIFQFLRIDAVWRFAPDRKAYPGAPTENFSNFGIFGSLRFQL
jgi:hypothetical protein